MGLILWTISFLIDLALMASTFYQIVILTDLESDYINIYDTASRINHIVVPEFIVQGVLCAIFLVTWHWFMFLITVPLTCYHVMLFLKRQHLFDVTEAFRFLSAEKKFRLIKLGFYLVVFAIVTGRLALSAFEYLADMDDAEHLF
ncbi:protein cornichon homolog 1 [Corylus avellana]|uniref:protein cornichon homolog 1 n=1 Tax=Corylus avellana TaxID=13451 RepID=UPI00286CFFE4|nr:protein cornichon homolog 1 [Corylus avellana]XP_059428825.1 protein cornichon homolog 1 [Corylus avellana]